MRQSATEFGASEALPNPDARSYTAAHDARSEDMSTPVPSRAGALTRVEKILLAMMVAVIGSGALVFSQLIEMQREIGGLRSHMTEEIHREVGVLRMEMREEIAGLRSEVDVLRSEVAKLSERVARIETVLADRLPPR